MNWPLVIGMSYLIIGACLTLFGARLTLSQLSMRTFRTPVPRLSAKPLLLGIACLAVGALMLATTMRLADWLKG